MSFSSKNVFFQSFDDFESDHAIISSDHTIVRRSPSQHARMYSLTDAAFCTEVGSWGRGLLAAESTTAALCELGYFILIGAVLPSPWLPRGQLMVSKFVVEKTDNFDIR